MSSTRRTLAAVLAAVLSLSGGPELAGQEPPARVDEVRVSPRGLVQKVELRQLLAVKAPGAWDEAAVTRTRERLLATGRFATVEPILSTEGGRNVLTFTVAPRAWVRKIVVKGRHQLPQKTLLDRLELKSWRKVPDDGGASVPAQVADAYARSGLPAPEVAVAIGEPDREGATRVTLRLTEQPLPRLASLTADLDGLPWVTALSTRGRLLGQRWGAKLKRWNRKKLDDALRKEQKRLRQLGWKGAVFRVEEVPAPADGKVAVTVRLELGPRESLEGKGIDRPVMKEVASSWKRRNVPLSDGVVNRLAKAASEGMTERGYLDVEVTPSLREEDGRKTATLTATHGPRARVEAIRFEGADSIPGRALLRAVPVHAPRLLGLSRSHPGPEILEESRLALLDLYARSGFPDASVVVATEGEGAGQTVVFRVGEGRRRTVSSLAFPGARSIPLAELHRLVTLRVGDSFWPGAADADAEEVRKEFTRRGYDDATVTPRPGAPDAAGQVALAFEVVEGPLYTLGISIVSGSFKTSVRKILSLGNEKPGKPVDPQELAKHQTRLTSLGVFDTVSVTPQAAPGAPPGRKDVLLAVTERPTGYFEYGADINTDRGLELAGTVGERNLFGLATKGAFSVLAGKMRQSVNLELGQPALFGTRLYSTLKAGYIYDTTYPGFSLQTVSGQIGFSWEFDPKRRLSLVYELEDQTPFDVEPDVEDEAATEAVRIGSLTPTVTLDQRDDPFFTTTGSFVLGRVKISRRFLGGSSDYNRWEADLREFRTVNGDYTVAANLRAGVTSTFSGSQLPVGERFYIGGSTTHRGFKQNQLGPVGEDGSVLGGESYVLGNVELRLPLLGTFEGGVFLDVGNAFLGSIDLSDLRWGGGLGLRVKTPVGPVRVDLGWKLDRREGEAPTVLHFALGHAF